MPKLIVLTKYDEKGGRIALAEGSILSVIEARIDGQDTSEVKYMEGDDVMGLYVKETFDEVLALIAKE